MKPSEIRRKECLFDWLHLHLLRNLRKGNTGFETPGISEERRKGPVHNNVKIRYYTHNILHAYSYSILYFINIVYSFVTAAVAANTQGQPDALR
jgi:hypothetical protein